MDSQAYKDQDTRSGAVNGARSDQSNITLDGVDVNDLANGYAFTSVPVTLDSVQEFRVTTTNYNADQGDGSGAQVALITKSGTNNFHGSAYESDSTAALPARVGEEYQDSLVKGGRGEWPPEPAVSRQNSYLKANWMTRGCVSRPV
jgi:hypothetical protein